MKLPCVNLSASTPMLTSIYDQTKTTTYEYDTISSNPASVSTRFSYENLQSFVNPQQSQFSFSQNFQCLKQNQSILVRFFFIYNKVTKNN